MTSQDIDQMKDAMRAPWIAGNFGTIAKPLARPPPRASSLGWHLNWTSVNWISPVAQAT